MPLKRNELSSTTDEHEHLLLSLSSRLSSLLCQKRFLLSTTTTISVVLRRFDQSTIEFNLSSTARVFELKRTIEEKFDDPSIHWKAVWRRYLLVTDDQQSLIHPNRSIQSYGISNDSQLTFARRRRSK